MDTRSFSVLPHEAKAGRREGKESSGSLADLRGSRNLCLLQAGDAAPSPPRASKFCPQFADLKDFIPISSMTSVTFHS